MRVAGWDGGGGERGGGGVCVWGGGGGGVCCTTYLVQLGKPGVTMVLAGHVHSTQDTVMDVDRACNQQVQHVSTSTTKGHQTWCEGVQRTWDEEVVAPWWIIGEWGTALAVLEWATLVGSLLNEAVMEAAHPPARWHCC